MDHLTGSFAWAAIKRLSRMHDEHNSNKVRCDFTTQTVALDSQGRHRFYVAITSKIQQTDGS